MKYRVCALAFAAACTTVGWSATASAADCTPAEKAAGDAAIVAFSADATKVAAAREKHLPWGEPVETSPTTNEMTLVQADYVIRYDADLRVPVWTAERIDSARLDDSVKREDCFREDPRLDKNVSSLKSDYDEPIYDQGHMTPFANQRYTEMTGHNSFIMTNMAPQNCQLNRGIWQILEQITRRWAARHDKLYVFSGSVLDRDDNGVRDADDAAARMKSRNGKTRVAVPTAFYKIIAHDGADGKVEMVSFLLPHDTSNPTGPAALAYLEQHVTDLATIERLSGLDLFPRASGVRESRKLWEFDGYKPQSLCNQRAPA